MPNFSAVTRATTATADTAAPDVVKFLSDPTPGPSGFATSLGCPTNDAGNNGTDPQTGLDTVYLVHAPIVGGVKPFDNLTPQEILALPGSVIQSWNKSSGVAPGATIDAVTVDDNPGGSLDWAAFCHDGAA